MIKIKFTDLWPDLPLNDNLFIWLIESIFHKKTKVVSNIFEKCDILFCGSFVPKVDSLRSLLGWIYWQLKFIILKKRSKNKIWVSGEYKNLPKHNYNIFLSFFDNNFDKRNLYFPTWFMLENAFESGSPSAMMDRLGLKIDFQKLLNRRNPISEFKNNQVGYFVTNYNLDRQLLVKEMEKFLEISLLGKNFSSGYIEFKSSYLDKFNFILCPENKFNDDYISEKLIESYVLNAIPVWGGKDTFGYFNENSYINILNYNSYSTLGEHLFFLQNNLEEYNKIFTEPLLKKLPSFKIFEDFIKNHIKLN